MKLYNILQVCRLDGTSRRALFWQGLQEPRSIVLEPLYGLLYWSEWGGNGRIRQASLDGQNSLTLTSNLDQPRSLTIDSTTRQLYWIDGTTESQIQGCTIPNCSEKQTILSNLLDPISLAAYKRVLYFSERRGDSYSYISGNKTRLHQSKSKSGASALKVVYSGRKGHRNQCSVSNGGCSHLCLALPQKDGTFETKSYVCACPTHYTLNGNNSCVPPKSFMVYSQRNSVVRFVPDTKDCPEAVMPIHNLKTIKAVTFDPVSRYLYWVSLNLFFLTDCHMRS